MLFSIAAAQVCIPTSHGRGGGGFLFSTPSPAFIIIDILMVAILTRPSCRLLKSLGQVSRRTPCSDSNAGASWCYLTYSFIPACCP